MYDCFYGQQAGMFAFYRIPKALFQEHFWNVSTEAKLLYGILLDRMELSARNGWMDTEGRVYIIFTIEEIKNALGCAEKRAVKLLDELEKRCGLIERKRQGLGKPYVKNFTSGIVDKYVNNSVERQFWNCPKDNSNIYGGINCIFYIITLINHFVQQNNLVFLQFIILEIVSRWSLQAVNSLFAHGVIPLYNTGKI